MPHRCRLFVKSQLSAAEAIIERDSPIHSDHPHRSYRSLQKSSSISTSIIDVTIVIIFTTLIEGTPTSKHSSSFTSNTFLVVWSVIDVLVLSSSTTKHRSVVVHIAHRCGSSVSHTVKWPIFPRLPLSIAAMTRYVDVNLIG